ncbi:MAG: hypothetical protein JXB47_10680 [Anaerolineae bacterium]|nr:hypothetical protein [Anaerolineae bacterium]
MVDSEPISEEPVEDKRPGPDEPAEAETTDVAQPTRPMRTRRATPAEPVPLPPPGDESVESSERSEPSEQPPPPRPHFPRRDPHRAALPAYQQPALPDAPVAPPRAPAESGLYFPWWSVVGMVVIVGGLACGIWGLVYMGGGGAPPGGRTPTIIVMTATVTLVEPTLPSTAAPPTATPRLEPTATATLPPSNITMDIGVTVEIVGTGTAGLSMREGAGTDYAVLDVARDGETFIVEDGPQFGSGYEWWYIVDPGDPDRAGWSVRQYMQAVAPALPTEAGAP